MWVPLVIGAVTCLAIGLILFLSIGAPRPRPATDKEREYQDVLTGEKRPFPWTTRDAPSKYLTVVIPAYNETARLGGMLDETLEYLEKRLKKDPDTFSFEILVVDDGSKDETTRLALDYGHRYLSPKRKKEARDFRVMTFQKNRGKGGAVREVGVLMKLSLSGD